MSRVLAAKIGWVVGMAVLANGLAWAQLDVLPLPVNTGALPSAPPQITLPALPAAPTLPNNPVALPQPGPRVPAPLLPTPPNLDTIGGLLPALPPSIPNLDSGNVTGQLPVPIRDVISPVLDSLPQHLPPAAAGIIGNLGTPLGALPISGSAVGSVSNLLPYLPPALAELMLGVGPQLSCQSDPSCWLAAVSNPQSAAAAALSCEVLGGRNLDLSFGRMPSGQRARDYRVNSSIAVRCPAGTRFQLSLAGLSGAAGANGSRFEIEAGGAPAWVDLRSNGLMLPEASFYATGEVQLIPLEAWVSSADSLSQTPGVSGQLVLRQAVSLTVLQAR